MISCACRYATDTLAIIPRLTFANLYLGWPASPRRGRRGIGSGDAGVGDRRVERLVRLCFVGGAFALLTFNVNLFAVWLVHTRLSK